MMVLEGITGFELGNVLDAAPVCDEQEKKLPTDSLAGRKQDQTSSGLQWIQAITFFICQLKIQHPLKRLSMDRMSLYTSLLKAIWLRKEFDFASVCADVLLVGGSLMFSERQGGICNIKETCRPTFLSALGIQIPRYGDTEVL